MCQNASAIAAPMTRSEVAAAVRDAFQLRNVSRALIIAAAERSSARPPIIAALQTLPRESYSDIRQLWGDLPEMPLR